MASMISYFNTLKSTSLFFSLLFLQLSLLIKGHGDESSDTDHGENVDFHSKHLILVKIWCLIILLVSTFAAGVSAYFYRWNESFLLLGTQFAGGVFLGTSLMHFLSDSAETFADLTTKTYPFAFMLASAGYLLTMLGDCIISYVTNASNREARVLVVEEGRTPEERAKELHMNELSPEFLRTSSLGDTILLILALCFHSVFEGIAVGVAGKINIGALMHNLSLSFHNINLGLIYMEKDLLSSVVIAATYIRRTLISATCTIHG
ncbi:hypothetical protein F2P56_032489 [Juglans regia]|uniref:Zinc transporter 2-like n=1 Tax=Juglans regia TaxID=51240 RepID=A0A833TYI0_JUGRE|nr:hypothetical protein F2P56_032489 [Juglans regia]